MKWMIRLRWCLGLDSVREPSADLYHRSLSLLLPDSPPADIGPWPKEPCFPPSLHPVFTRRSGHLTHSWCSCLTSVVPSLSQTRMSMTMRAQSSTLVHLAAQAYGRGLWSPRSANRRQSRPRLGCSVQGRRKRRAKISPYVLASLPHRNANHSSVTTVAAAPHRPHRPVFRATDPSDHTATTSHAFTVFFFTLAFNRSSFPRNTV